VCVCVEGGEYLKLIGILFFVKFRSPVKQTISERDDVKLLSEYVCSLSKTVITRNNGHSQWSSRKVTSALLLSCLPNA
jgi:hypothetical protein